MSTKIILKKSKQTDHRVSTDQRVSVERQLPARKCDGKKSWWRQQRLGERGDTVVLVVLLVFLIVVGMVVLPLERFCMGLRMNEELSRTRMMENASEEVQSQAANYIRGILLEAIGAHFQTAMEEVPGFRSALRRSRDPLPKVEDRVAFFNRGFLIMHFNHWLQQQLPNDDPRMNNVLSYLESLGSAAVLEIKYISSQPHSGAGRIPAYVLQCEVRIVELNVNSETDENPPEEKQIRLMRFGMAFIPSPMEQEANPQNLYLPGMVLYPVYESRRR